MSDEVEAVVAKLFNDARPRLLARVEALEAAAAGSRALHERAAIEAHTLIGTLGAFGRAEASETARAAEQALERDDQPALAAAAAALRAEVMR